jgi:FAD/FMN-containing dehydrogenase
LLQGFAATPALGLLGGCADHDDPRNVDDVSRIDTTRVARVVRPTGVAALARELARTRGPVSIGGARYSMGGQVAAPGSLHVDMRSLNRLVWLDVATRRVRVQAGMAWRDLQDLIDPHDLSVRIMQSFSNFTIGGSVGVNCHGRYVGRGPLVNSVRALQLVLADGRTLELSRERDPALFGAVFGGYGGLGVVTEVELELDRNMRIEREARHVGLEDYPRFFREEVLGRPDAVLHNADLAPPTFDAPLAITWRESTAALTTAARLVPRDGDYSRDQSLIWSVSEFPDISHGLREREVQRSVVDTPAVVWRNHEASLDTAMLEPRTRWMSTYLLQEYFVPVAAFLPFARAMARILAAHEVNALNVSIRHSPADATSLLRWAPQDVFSFVLYHKQRRYPRSDADAGLWTRELVEAALACGGRYYLPYRLHATPRQFARAYPEAKAFATLKRRVDPQGRFTNRLWQAYLPRVGGS